MKQELSAQVAALTALTEVDRVILDSPGIERILDTLITHACSVTGCDGAAIMLVDMDDADSARLYVSAEQAGDSHEIERITLPEGFAIDAAAGDFQLDGAILRHPYAARLAQRGMRRMLAQPVAGGSKETAAVLALGLRDAARLTQEHHSIARAFADRLGAALANVAREQRLYQQAYYDTLTGLPNRQLFKDRLDQELVRAGRSGELLGLLYVDLDQFKHINDTLGHGAGDELLRDVSERLRIVVKDTDTVARLGGDEFVAILPQLTTPEAAGRVAERIMSELSEPVLLKGREHRISASIGIAISPQDGRLPDELIKNADTAMYRAKRGGRNRVLFYESFMNTRVLERSTLETGLFRALKASQFVLHYQPQIEMSGGALASAEALIRWDAPQRGQREPAEFLPVAEESGLIVEIGRWALEEICRQYTQWRNHGTAPPRLALNISAEQLRRSEFLQMVRDALLRWDMPPWALELEFPEAALLGDLERTAGTLGALSDIGVRLAVDDFGTGLSSLSCLRHYPIHMIKIDRSFIGKLPHSAEATAVAGAIIGMARSLGKQTMAEGLETIEQFQHLRDLGCDFAQGYYFAAPMNAVEFAVYMASRSPAPYCESPAIEQGRQPGGQLRP